MDYLITVGNKGDAELARETLLIQRLRVAVRPSRRYGRSFERSIPVSALGPSLAFSVSTSDRY